MKLSLMDAIGIALIYKKISNLPNSVTLDEALDFRNEIGINLNKMNSKSRPYDDGDLLYLFNYMCDENGITTYSLKNEIDFEEVKRVFLFRNNFAVLGASQMDNALNTLNLRKINGRIKAIDKDNYKSI